MENEEKVFYTPRLYNTIELWKDVTPQQWNDPAWQLKNTIGNVEALKKVIN